jgi:hypothetical protein
MTTDRQTDPATLFNSYDDFNRKKVSPPLQKKTNLHIPHVLSIFLLLLMHKNLLAGDIWLCLARRVAAVEAATPPVPGTVFNH